MVEGLTPSRQRSKGKKRKIGDWQRVQTPVLTHNFRCDKDDHCETPGKAYEDVVPLLKWYAKKIGKSENTLLIYDPYYCNGAVKRNFAKIGFMNVYNRNEDFYKVVSENKQPDFDVLVTNPPYSEDHIERCIRFCLNSNKPYFLLLPNYVYTNVYYKEMFPRCSLRPSPFFVIPPCRYQYTSPTGARSERETKTSPWVSFWYCNAFGYNAQLIKCWREKEKKADVEKPFRAKLFGNLSRLPHNMRAQYDKSRRRLRKKQRISMSLRGSKQRV